MFKVNIYIPNIMDEPFSGEYRSLRHASQQLGLSYYFIYNCFHKKHNNQFASFVTITNESTESDTSGDTSQADSGGTDYDLHYPTSLLPVTHPPLVRQNAMPYISHSQN